MRVFRCENDAENVASIPISYGISKNNALCELAHAKICVPTLLKIVSSVSELPANAKNRRRTMKTIFAALLITSAITAPVLAQSTPPWSETVIVDQKYIGQDPDANVRLMLRRDAGSEHNY